MTDPNSNTSRSHSPPSHYRTLIPDSPSRPPSASSFLGSQEKPVISVRIVHADHYLGPPLPSVDPTVSAFRFNAPVKRVPVIRVFGATPAGQKTLLHIHGVFPYVYAPFEKDVQRQFRRDGSEELDPTSLNGFLVQLANSIDKALNISIGKGQSNEQHVFRIVVARGKPFYGFHEEEEDYLKIYLYNPSNVKKLADLLLAGAIMSLSFQPHEAHIPFLLQFFIDYNLYGMNFIHLSSVKFRPFLEPEESPYSIFANHLTRTNSQSQRWWSAEKVAPEHFLPQDSPIAKRHGRCQIEADAAAIDIVNRKELEQNADGENPGLAALWEDEKERRRKNEEESFIQTQFSHDSTRIKDPIATKSKSELFFYEKLKEKFNKEYSITTDRRRHTSEGQFLASQVLSHPEHSFSSAPSSERESEPVVDEASILEVVSQSVRRRRGSALDERTFSGDQTIVDILADLVGREDEENVSDEEAVSAEEEARREEYEDQDEKETLEMTQIWSPVEAEDLGISDKREEDESGGTSE